jgi:hypothetical protein
VRRKARLGLAERAIGDARVRRGLLQLGRARVGGDHGAESLRQGNRGDAGAGATIPREIVVGGDTGEEVEQGRRIAGAELRVVGGDAGEVISERDGAVAHPSVRVRVG